jgi:hypothetical protein
MGSDDEVMQEFRLAREREKWPRKPLRQGTILTNLHTLEIYPFYFDPDILTLPALRCVGARLDIHDRA